MERSGMMRLWLDTDIGTDVDDAVALLCALRHPEVELVGVSTVLQNVDMRAWIAREMLARAGREGVPVLPGAMARLDGTYLEGENFPPQAARAPRAEPSPDHDGARIEAVARTMKDVSGPFHLLTIGPLTNAAYLLRDPKVTAKWQSVTCMAGRLERPEWNIMCDVGAAERTFRALNPRVIGYEACSNVLAREEVEEVLDPSDPASALLLECYELYRARPRHADPETAPMTLYDAIALLSLLHEDWFEFQDLRVMVEKDGRLRLTDDGVPIHYATSSDWARIKPAILGMLAEQ